MVQVTGSVEDFAEDRVVGDVIHILVVEVTVQVGESFNNSEGVGEVVGKCIVDGVLTGGSKGESGRWEQVGSATG